MDDFAKFPIEGERFREKRAKILMRLLKVGEDIDGFDGEFPESIFDSKDESRRREFIARISEEQYRDLITGVNGILREKQKEEWGMDGCDVALSEGEGVHGHTCPRQEDKKVILDESWKAAQRMNKSGRSLEDIGLLLGSVLVETHPFQDGNGRTSRFVSWMVSRGYSREKVDEILSEDGRFEYDMNLPKKYYDRFFEQRYGRFNESLNIYSIAGLFPNRNSQSFGGLLFPEGVSDKVKRAIIEGGRNDDGLILLFGVFELLKRHSEIAMDTCVEFYPQRNILILQEFLSNVGKDLVEELCELYWDLKRKYVENIIDVFENPDKPEYAVERSGTTMQILDYFKSRLS